jgi:nucleoside-diphosphate-sugar epimerase
VLDDLSATYPWLIPHGSRITFVEGSVLDEETLRRVFAHRPEIIYHLAAHFANQNSVDHPETDLMVNGMGTLKTLEYAQLVDVERFIYASSGCGIYGQGASIPFDEADVSLRLTTPYQVTKMLGELYTNCFHALYGLPIVNARFFNSYGPGEVPGRYRNVIPNFFYWALQQQPLPITGTGAETRDFTYVGDLVQGLFAMASQPVAIGEAFNLASGREIRIRDLAEAINQLTENPAGIHFTPRRHWDQKTRSLASITKAQRLLHYHPETPFTDGLAAVHRWFTTHWSEITQCAAF